MIARPAVLVAMALSSLVAGKADANYFDGNELLRMVRKLAAGTDFRERDEVARRWRHSG